MGDREGKVNGPLGGVETHSIGNSARIFFASRIFGRSCNQSCRRTALPTFSYRTLRVLPNLGDGVSFRMQAEICIDHY
jgi:hypothetical protein